MAWFAVNAPTISTWEGQTEFEEQIQGANGIVCNPGGMCLTFIRYMNYCLINSRFYILRNNFIFLFLKQSIRITFILWFWIACPTSRVAPPSRRCPTKKCFPPYTFFQYTVFWAKRFIFILSISNLEVIVRI